MNLAQVRDVGIAERRVRDVAAQYGFEVVEVLLIDPSDRDGLTRLIEQVHRHGAHAVVVGDEKHLRGFEKAVAGVADLVSPTGVRPYVGYGAGHRRPSVVGPVGRR